MNPDKLEVGSLRPESNSPGGSVYPHIYGKIPLLAVIKSESLSSDT